MKKPAYSQISSLISVLNDKVYSDHFGIFDWENAFKPLTNISIRQYNYLNALMFEPFKSRQWFKIKKILVEFGVPLKDKLK